MFPGQIVTRFVNEDFVFSCCCFISCLRSSYLVCCCCSGNVAMTSLLVSCIVNGQFGFLISFLARVLCAIFLVFAWLSVSFKKPFRKEDNEESLKFINPTQSDLHRCKLQIAGWYQYCSLNFLRCCSMPISVEHQLKV